jgi:hypothetical protein
MRLLLQKSSEAVYRMNQSGACFGFSFLLTKIAVAIGNFRIGRGPKITLAVQIELLFSQMI